MTPEIQELLKLFPGPVVAIAAATIIGAYALVQRLARSGVHDLVLAFVQIAVPPAMAYLVASQVMKIEWAPAVIGTLLISMAALAKSPVYDAKVEKKADVVDTLKDRVISDRPDPATADIIKDELKAAEKEVETKKPVDTPPTRPEQEDIP